jgi:potassium-dependent mechanosensitive channel
MLKFTIRLLPLIACFSLAGLASMSGQTTSASAATNAVATNLPAAIPPTPPQSIALSDVLTQAQTVIAKLRDDQTSLTTDSTAETTNANLPALTSQIDQHAADDAKLLEESPSLSSLQNSQASWQSLADNLGGLEKSLSDRTEQVNKTLIRLSQWQTQWQATLNAQQAAAPADVVQQIKMALAAIADTTKVTEAAQTQIFSLQARIDEQKNRITNGLAAIAKAQSAARTELFKQDHPPLWRSEAVRAAGAGIVEQEKVSLHTQLAELKTYLADKIPALLIHLLLLALLVIGFYWIRNEIQLHAKEEAALHHAARVFDMPLGTALLLTLLATGWLYPLAPRLLWAAAGATALVPAVIIIRRLIEPANHSILYATVIAYFVDQLRYVVTPAGILSRFLFIFELLAASIFLLTMLHSKHLSASSPETNRLKKGTRIYLHLAFIIFVFAGFANVFGYVHLSLLVGNGMLESSYFAVIFYAAVRIADAVAISALSIRPFASLGMVRRHHDLLYNNIAAAIRWLAFALWFLAALQLFSLRDPLREATHKLLTTPISWFSITFSLGAVLAFPVTVWASFLLSRFIRFALEEEVYPHLQLGRGIPYAASTMVHYIILVIGFFAAVAATGTQLTQFAFLAGAFGVGLGFGLQNIMNNFVSGIILLFERPIKVGDIVQIDTNMGTVERIGIRASVILLTNGSELIVPNGNLISNPVTNWTLSNCERLIEIPVNVTSKVDPQHVLKLLTDAARSHPSVLKNPSPQALLVTFGGTALAFRLRVWIDSEEEWMKITSDLSLAINSALTKENIAMG